MGSMTDFRHFRDLPRPTPLEPPPGSRCTCGNTPKRGTAYCNRCDPDADHNQPTRAERIENAAENVVIAFAMGWDLGGVVDALRQSLES